MEMSRYLNIECIPKDEPVQVVYVSRRDVEGRWYTTEEFAFQWLGNYDKALRAAIWLVDDALSRLYRHGMSAEELFSLYKACGPERV